MTGWKILGRSHFAPAPADWRAALATRLGQRPRRIGSWAELALYGALACLDDAGETTLPSAALLSVASLSGPEIALLGAVAQIEHELPLPIAFLQSLPGQVLPVLAQHLRWSGNGRCVATRDPLEALHLACLEADSGGGVMLGWVDETAGSTSIWLRAVAANLDEAPARAVKTLDVLLRPESQAFTFDRQGRLFVA